jgi:hypothetical protein
MVMVDARPKVGVGVDDVFVPASTNRFVLMFQVVWWCWLCCFKLLVMLMFCPHRPRGGADVSSCLMCCGVVWLWLMRLDVFLCCGWSRR